MLSQMQCEFDDELYDELYNEFRKDLIEVIYSGESVWPGTRGLNNQNGADLPLLLHQTFNIQTHSLHHQK